jgi:hypothetical protein
MQNDSLITATIHISGKSPAGWDWIIVADQFLNNYYKDSALHVLLSIPVVPTLKSPLNNSIDQLQNPVLLWDSNASASSFRIQVSSDSLFSISGIILDTVTSNTPLHTRPNLLALGVKYFWRVSATNIVGTSAWSTIWNFTVRETGISVISSEIPPEYRLYNNFPNPFNPTTTIRYSIPNKRAGHVFVVLKIYDMLGKEITTLVNQNQEPGIYQISFNTSGFNLSSGIYLYKLMTSDFVQTKKMAVVK